MNFGAPPMLPITIRQGKKLRLPSPNLASKRDAVGRSSLRIHGGAIT
jgi:hypothetical protein